MSQPPSAPDAVQPPDGAPARGPVTLLMTDIEGSTRLLQEAGAAYADLLEGHRRLVRSAVAAHGGREIDTQGDSFFVAFPTAVEAVAAAAEIGRAMAGHRWPGRRELRVRMGLHTGEVSAAGTGFIGLGVHRAARIAAAAHGGQVLLSEATASLVRDGLPDGVALRDLGQHRLKDFPRVVRLYQLDVRGLRVDFPPLRTLVRGSGLPAPTPPILGREDDVAAVRRLLGEQSTRLVTLTGPGGVGKTRLALEAARAVADDFPGGAVFVPLAALTDPALVLGAIGDALGARRESGSDPVAAVASAVGDARTLLVLDNLEQVVEAAPELARLLDGVPGLVVLATSRQLLRLRTEHQYPVAPLPDAPAAQLFTARARAVRPELDTGPAQRQVVGEIIRRLDGLPLAIELAAARTRLLEPRALLDRLGARLDALGDGPVDLPARQRTLRATMDWSYCLLEPHQQRLFVRLAVFAGGWTLAAAEAVCARPGEPDVVDTLAGLVDTSLVVVSDDAGERRYGMLKPVHAYVAELLASSPDRADTERAHTAWSLDLADAVRAARAGKEHRTWTVRLDHERPNLRAAVERALDGGDVATVALLARDVFVDLAQRDAEAEVAGWLDRALPQAAGAVRGRLLAVRALIATIFADFPLARAMAQEAGALLPASDEWSYDRGLVAAAEAYVVVGEDPAAALGPVTAAAALLAAAGERLGQAYLEVAAGTVALFLGDLRAAESHHASGAALAAEIGDDAMRGRALSLRGLVLLLCGNQEAARRWVVEGARVNRRGGQPTGMAYSLDGLAALALAMGCATVAARALAAARATRERAGNPASAAFVPLLDDLTARARDHLGDRAYEAAAAEGGEWWVVEALDRTLDALVEAPPDDVRGDDHAR
ncbi:adenylate/guanylate cyclase domain-containing protein [Blastococcus sp. CCUG 61487]|uniref:adenylate/guanylate cyclase domain-containing protein n=1 Tax=Blastococcus sp. CCUG 61487 TaxID=1840703 RepID=UPI0010C1355C|nr:adenylate/guanylate cyclase domain-containing protein [Blastococcus sp. CCUG 61487]TKJ28858.1 hypothetical protein A6V29_02415 [Blastococcus sp. CCUG 61487]